MTQKEKELLEALKLSNEALKDVVSQLPVEQQSFSLDFAETVSLKTERLINQYKGL